MKKSKPQVLQDAFRNPLFSCVAKFLPLRTLFASISLVCGAWSVLIFNLQHVRIDERDHLVGVIGRVNCSYASVVEVYAKKPWTVWYGAQHFKHAKVLCVSSVDDQAFCELHSVEHLFVLQAGVPRSLPPSLVSLTLCTALQCDCLPLLPNLRKLGGVVSLDTTEDVEALKRLNIEQARFEITDANYVNHHPFPQGLQFELFISDKVQALLDLAEPNIASISKISLDLQYLTPNQFTTLAAFPNITKASLWGRCPSASIAPGAWPRAWPQLVELILENDMALSVFGGFIKAAKLTTVQFNSFEDYERDFCSELKHDLHQVTTLQFVNCCVGFTTTVLSYFESVACVSIRHAGLLPLTLLPNRVKIVAMMVHAWTQRKLQKFLSCHAFSIVLLSVEEDFKVEGQLAVPEGTLVVMPNFLENKLRFQGRVHFQDKSTLSIQGGYHEVFREFYKCIKTL